MTIDEFKLMTSRLELRPHQHDDADFMIDLNSDAEVTRHVPDGPLESVRQAVEIIESLRTQFKEKRIGRFIVLEKESGERIGWCGIKWLEDVKEMDLGYRFQRSSWGKGYASEAAKACLDYGFNTLGLGRMTARIAPRNAASIAVAKKIGMSEIDQVVEVDFEYLVFEIHASDFNAR